MLPRFFLPDAATQPAGPISLPREEAHHATRVLRLREGAEVVVFDGVGGEWLARILQVTKGAVRIELIESREPAPEPRVAVTLLQAVLKGDRMDAVVRDATMLGVSAIVPIVTAHSAAHPRAARGEHACERWTRVAIASAKQCRRSVLPAVASSTSAADALEALPAGGQRIVLAEPASARPGVALDAIGGAPPRAVLAVGPEGGWSTGELEAFSAAGFDSLTIGAFTLRADAAALVALSMLRARWGDLPGR